MILDVSHGAGICQSVQGHVHSFFQMVGLEFRFFSNIYHDQIRIVRKIHQQFICFYVNDEINFLTSIRPGFITTLQVSLDLIKSYSGQSHNTLFLFTGFSDQQHGCVKGKESACPFGKSSFQSDTDGAGHET